MSEGLRLKGAERPPAERPALFHDVFDKSWLFCAVCQKFGQLCIWHIVIRTIAMHPLESIRNKFFEFQKFFEKVLVERDLENDHFRGKIGIKSRKRKIVKMKMKSNLTGKVSCIQIDILGQTDLGLNIFTFRKKELYFFTAGDYLLNQYLQPNELILDHFDTPQVLSLKRSI